MIIINIILNNLAFVHSIDLNFNKWIWGEGGKAENASTFLFMVAYLLKNERKKWSKSAKFPQKHYI